VRRRDEDEDFQPYADTHVKSFGERCSVGHLHDSKINVTVCAAAVFAAYDARQDAATTDDAPAAGFERLAA